MKNVKFKTMAEVSAVLPGHPHISAIWRWCRRGLKARNGERIKLAHVRIGGKIYVRDEDVESFLAALTAADLTHFDTPPPPPVFRKRTEAQRRRAVDAANKRLAAAGI